MLTFEQIKELIELVGTHRLEGLEVETSGFRVKITGDAGGRSGIAQAPAVAGDSTILAGASAPALPVASAASPAVSAPVAAVAPGTHILTSPIVGTFYSSPSPDAESFVSVGSRVKTGQVLCIVEAMKLMNEIESDIDGVIAEIYPQNSQPVEFGEPLYAIRPG